MPWLSIIMAIISALASLKKNPENKGRAIAAGALAGLGTYYVTHNTEWGQENLGALDGVITPSTNATAVVKDSNGNVVTGTNAAGQVVPLVTGTTSMATPTSTTGAWDVLKAWGPGGVATVVGTTAVATSSKMQSYLPWIIGGAIAFMILKQERRPHAAHVLV